MRKDITRSESERRATVQYEFSVISPMYNVAAYLPEFLTSLVDQTYDFEHLQVILVDDGSTDDTLAVARSFAAGKPNVTVLTKQNGGQASARNLGISAASGIWLTFPDPDDVLAPDYFSIVSEAARESETTPAMLSTRLLLWYELSGETADTHALTGRFAHGTVTKNLNASPSWIQAHITSGFVQRAIVQDAELRFVEKLRYRFEDGNFVARYLLLFDAPEVTFLPDATYLYRQRADNSSTIQANGANPLKYTDTIRYGYLPIIDQLIAEERLVPRWLQNLFLYDQFWILRSSQHASIRNNSYPDAMYEELGDLLSRFCTYIDDERIANFDIMPVAPWMREALSLLKRGSGSGPFYWGSRDQRRGLRSIIVRYMGVCPVIELHINGKPRSPLFTKELGLEYVGRPLVVQRTIWVPDDADIIIRVDGMVQTINTSPPSIPGAFRTVRPKPGALRDLLTKTGKAVARRLGRGGIATLRQDFALRSGTLASRFKNAWVFIDRDTDAGDSAEDQYWWMREHHPEANAWFVVRKGTPDWARLNDRGARLVAYGSPAFLVLLREAKHLASSHADRFITNALPKKLLPARYAFTFLQHGVIKGDISSWLNAKDIHMFVTSTQSEYDYVTGPDRFRFGSKEVQLTGLPRFDVLAERAALVPSEERDVILVAPTWRDYLVGQMGTSSADRTRSETASSVYLDSWSDLLGDRQVLSSAAAAGKRIVFMPHPNMRPFLKSFTLPPEIEVASYADTDVRELLIRAAALVTDYSSIAFNAAFLKTPVVYFQFDRSEYEAGHTEGPGYFEYERDGFGPVTATSKEAVTALIEVIESGPASIHAQRMEETFPFRDGKNRERVFRAMLEATTRRSYD